MSVKYQPGFMPWDRSGNRILIQSALGKNKDTNYDIPDQKHSYGDAIFQDPQHADLLMYKWKYHQNSNNQNIGKEKDFIKTNMNCTKNLLSSSKDFSGFRKTGQSFVNPKQGTKYMKIKLPDQQYAYGKPLEKQDPVKFVLANQYGQMDKYSRHTHYMNQTWRSQEQSKRKMCFHKTKNYHLMKNAVQKRRATFDWNNKKDKQYETNSWKLSQYSKIPAKTQPPRQRQLTPQQASKILENI